MDHVLDIGMGVCLGLLTGMALAAYVFSAVLADEELRKDAGNEFLSGTLFAGKDISARNAVIFN